MTKNGLILILILGTFINTCNNPETKSTPDAREMNTNVYDSLLAAKYGADDYGMKTYVMAFLYKGPNRDLDSAKRAALQLAHLENITKMAEEGKLVLAGPFFGEGDLRGIYIFNVSSLEEARALTNTDPAVIAGSLRMELMEWYGSAGLQGLNELHKKLAKKSITD